MPNCESSRAAGIVKPFSHLTIVVRERPEAEEK